MVNNAEGLISYLVSWLEMVARSLGKDKIYISEYDTTTAANVLRALAAKTKLEVTTTIDDKTLILDDRTADNYLAARYPNGSGRGGPDSDALPLASLHESEVNELATYLEAKPGWPFVAISSIPPVLVERAIRVTTSLCGEAKSEAFMQTAAMLESLELSDKDFISVLREIGKNEQATRARFNPNIPVPAVRQQGMGFVS